MTDSSRIFSLPATPSAHSRTITYATGSTTIGALVDLKSREYGGSYEYPIEDQRSFPELQNRFLLWRAIGDTVEFEELSTEVELLENCLNLRFKNDFLMPGLTVRSCNNRLYVLVPTFSVAQRICISYQNLQRGRKASFLARDASSRDKPISLLASLVSPGLAPSRSQYVLNIATGSATPRTAASELSSCSEALFAYGLTDASIILITMPPIEDEGPASQQLLAQSSNVRRILTGLMSPFNRSENLIPETPITMAFETCNEDSYLFTASYDCKIRVWSTRRKEVVNTTSLSALLPEFLQHDILLDYVDGEKWRMKLMQSNGKFYWIVYACIDGISQFILLSALRSNRRTVPTLTKVLVFEAPEADLIDFSMSNQNFYALCQRNGSTFLYGKVLDMHTLEQGVWQIDPFITSYDDLIDINSDDVGRLAKTIFTPGLFSFEAIWKAIKVCRKNMNITSRNIYQLKREFFAYLENSASDLKSRSARLTFFRSLWSCCLQYDQNLKKPVSLFVLPRIGFDGLVLAKSMAVVADVNISCKDILGDPTVASRVSECLDTIMDLYASVDNARRSFDVEVLKGEKSPFDIIREQLPAAVFSASSAKVEHHILGLENCLQHVLESLVQYLNLSVVVVTSHVALSVVCRGIFRNSFGIRLLTASLDKLLRERYELSRTVLIFISLCMHYQAKIRVSAITWTFIENSCIPKLSQATHIYAILRWILNRQLMDISFDASSSPDRMDTSVDLTMPTESESKNGLRQRVYTLRCMEK